MNNIALRKIIAEYGLMLFGNAGYTTTSHKFMYSNFVLSRKTGSHLLMQYWNPSDQTRRLFMALTE